MVKTLTNLIDLDTWCWFRCVGPDAERYLQGQITQDIRLLENQPFIFGALLSNKGRMVSELRIFKSGEGYLLSGHTERRQEIQERFMRYLIADEVEIHSLDDFKAVFYADSLFLEQVGEQRDVLDFELFGIPGKIILTDSDLLNKHKLLSVRSLKYFRVRSFTPEWGFEMTEKTLLQELSDDEKWFSTKKGCYVGQEVVARVHSIGQVNRRLFLFTGGCQPAVEEGEVLLADGLEAGNVTSVASEGQGGDVFALGYLKRAFWDRRCFVTERGAVVCVVKNSI